jgi:hypothetical protein
MGLQSPIRTISIYPMVQQLEQTGVASPLIYPESDRKPLADNTLQFRLITHS